MIFYIFGRRETISRRDELLNDLQEKQREVDELSEVNLYLLIGSIPVVYSHLCYSN
jgi:hypothetical protein